MALYTTYFFLSGSGRSPVKEFIESLDFSFQRKFFYVKGLLEDFGPRLGLPHAKYLGDEIFELRFTGREGSIRVAYFFYLIDQIIFTNGFIKKSNKTPRNEKLKAMERRKLFLAGALKEDDR